MSQGEIERKERQTGLGMKNEKVALFVGRWSTEGRLLGSATNRRIVFLTKAGFDARESIHTAATMKVA